MEIRHTRKHGRRRLWLLLAVLVLALGAVAAACGGEEAAPPAPAEEPAPAPAEEPAPPPAEEPAPPPAEEPAPAAGEPIKVGLLSDCGGAFSAWFEQDIAGAHLALSEWGAVPASGTPSDGLSTNAVVAGREIQIVGYGCGDTTPDKAIEETRRLVEQLGAELFIGPLSGDEGIAIANYALEHPEVTFVNGTSGAQDTTLDVQAPNFFRYNTDGAQWSAGLGDYAYNVLGWRTAAIIGDDYSFPYTSLAGFVTEFCALGGQITARVWPPIEETDFSSWVPQIPEDVDGVYSAVGGSALLPFIKEMEAAGRLDPAKIMGNVFWGDPVLVQEFGDKLIGALTANPTYPDSTDPKATAYHDALAALYPDQAGLGGSVFVYNYYNNMKALLLALEQVGGDLSDGHAAFREALSGLVLDAPYGEIRLDENRQAIADNYVQQIVEDFTGDGVPDIKTIRIIPQVDQAFGGLYKAEDPSFDRENPKCVAGTPPAWVGNYVEVG
jgi:branched-chain amino acid transport system substrate-binding protein